MSDEMKPLEFVKAMFFSSDADFAAEQTPEPPTKRRRRSINKEMRALGAIVRGFNVLEELGDNHTAAALAYIEDRYGKVLSPRVRAGYQRGAR